MRSLAAFGYSLLNPHLSSSQIELLKWVGLLFMFADHARHHFFDFSSFVYVSRVVVPIFAFIAVYNFIHHSQNKRKYIRRLFLFACISFIPHQLYFSDGETLYVLNIIFMLALGLVALYAHELLQSLADIRLQIAFYPLLSVIVFFLSLYVSYYFMGVLMMISFYIWIKYPSIKSLYVVAGSLMLLNLTFLSDFIHLGYIISSLSFLVILELAMRISVQIPRTKGIYFYSFYPVHLALLALLKWSVA